MALTFTEKALIVSDFYEFYKTDHPEVIAKYDLGFPLAFALTYDAIDSLTDIGKEWIEESYTGLCEYLEVDPYGEYSDINALMEFAYEQG